MAWQHGVEFIVELALGTSGSGGLYGTAVYGTDVYGGSIPAWVPITPYVESVDFNRGADRFDDRIRTGLCTIVVDNYGGRFNPDDGADVLPGSLTLRPGRWVRVRAKAGLDAYGAVTDYTLFAGYVDTITEEYSQGGDDSIATIVCYDFSGVLALHNPPAASTQGSGETTGARIDRVLTEYGWEDTDVDTGQHTMIATTLSQNFLEECQRAAVAEGGAFYFEGLTATFRDFDWPAADTIAAYLGTGPFDYDDAETWDDPYGNTWTVNGDGVTLTFDDVADVTYARKATSALTIRNDVRVARDGGSEVRVTDTDSWVLYGHRTWQYYDYQLDNDTDVTALANKLLDAYAFDYRRLEAVTVHASSLTGAQWIFGAVLGSLVAVNVNLLLPGWGYIVEAHVLGVEYSITRDDWSATLRLDQSTRGNPEA